MDFRKYAVAAVISILYVILVQTTIDAFYPSPKYDDYCNGSYPHQVKMPRENSCFNATIPFSQEEGCWQSGGEVRYTYDENGCPVSFECSQCRKKFNEVNDAYLLVVFIMSSIFGVAAIIAGLYFPVEKNKIHGWVASGFMVGGLFAVFVGTARYYGEMDVMVRPFVILIELALVIYLSYKKLK
jgi:hypothetical protein